VCVCVCVCVGVHYCGSKSICDHRQCTVTCCAVDSWLTTLYRSAAEQVIFKVKKLVTTLIMVMTM